MKTIISEKTLLKLADASIKSSFRTHAAVFVSKHFRSMHYLSSKLICDCVILNVLLNDNITPNSANEIITSIRRNNRSFYTTVDNAYFPIESKFEEYAKTVLGENYPEIKALDMRNTNYIVFVISKDLKTNCTVDPNEIYYLAYDYAEIDGMEKFPHY